MIGSFIYPAPPLLGFLCRFLRGVQISSSSDDPEIKRFTRFFELEEGARLRIMRLVVALTS